MTTDSILKDNYSETTEFLTGKDIFEMNPASPAELIRGELIHMSPTGYTHGRVELKFGRIIDIFVEQHQLGQVFVGEVGIYTRRNPDTVRGADVIYISNERLSQSQSESYLDVAPELIVEVLSPHDRWYDVMDKLDEYFSIGVQEVWIADPIHKYIFVYESLTDVIRLTSDEKLSGRKILPGFEATVAELFGIKL